MKRWLCFVLAGILLLCCTACNSEPVCSGNSSASVSETEGKKFANAEEAYEYQLDTIRQTVDKTQLKEYWRYFYKDIDGNGVDLVCRPIIKKIKLTIYTFENGYSKLVGSERFGTATTRYFSSNNPKYPGIFMFSVGGGAEHYSYLTLADGKFVREDLWDDIYKYSETDRTREYFVSDEDIIKESAHLYQQGNDIKKLDFV